MKKLLLLLPIPVAALVWWIYAARTGPPEAPFAKVRRETLTSTLPTNGKAEPVEWSTVRAEAPGLVRTVPVQEGQVVGKGAVIATLSRTGLDAELRAAEARVAQARAEVNTLEAGGRSAELAEIESSLARARYDREVGQREYAALRRLVEKRAATPAEVEAARGKVREAELQIEALDRKRGSLVSKNDRSAAQARLRDAEAALDLARERVTGTVVRAPLAGVVYALAARPGSYVEEGASIAEIGRLDRLRVRIYVDEPELGRVKVGQPVTIAWDAKPGRTWEGTVERIASQIEALGTRQVGEVVATIENPARELVPGTNVNAEIRTNVAANALTIPKEALRREGGEVGVFVLREGDTLAWQPVETGASSVTRVQVVKGLNDGHAVALPSDLVLKPGMRVAPVYP